MKDRPAATDGPPRPEPWWTRLYGTPAIVVAAVAVGWTGIVLAMGGHREGYLLAVVTTLLAVLAVHRSAVLKERDETRLRQALAGAAARNRELETLRRLAASQLAGHELPDLYQQVAEAATELLRTEVGLVCMVVEEGRFMKVVAASGALEAEVGQLVPIDQSLVGWVALHDESVVTDNLERDPRNFPVEDPAVRLGTAAVIPLRSAGLVIGTISVYNRIDQTPFSASDIKLLETLGDQVVVGLDRASMLAETRQNEEALVRKNRELLRATHLKDQFLANISHELRTPLNAIIGFSDLLLTEELGALNASQRDFLESVLSNGRHLLQLINDVLDLSKIEAGRMELALTETDIREAVNAAVTDTMSLRAAKDQTCTVQMDDLPMPILADGTRVRQILYNLLSNASKFTPERGQITIAVVQTTAPLPVPDSLSTTGSRLSARDVVWISVMDTGIGIRRDDLHELFTEFTQLDSSASRAEQGTGLGLALCRKFVEMHGGTIGAESIHGRGSTFWFLLPVDGPRTTSALEGEYGIRTA